nr:hypothetical protein [Pseudomonas sp.]
MSSHVKVPASPATSSPQAREEAIRALLDLQGIAASPAELRSASRAWQRLNPLGQAAPPAGTAS